MTAKEQFEKECEEKAREYSSGMAGPEYDYISGYRACLNSTVVMELVEALELFICPKTGYATKQLAHKALSNLNSIKGEMK